MGYRPLSLQLYLTQRGDSGHNRTCPKAGWGMEASDLSSSFLVGGGIGCEGHGVLEGCPGA